MPPGSASRRSWARSAERTAFTHPDGDLVGAVRAGMTKVNIATHLNNAFTTALRGHLADDPDVVDPRRYIGAARDALTAEAARLLELLALR